MSNVVLIGSAAAVAAYALSQRADGRVVVQTAPNGLAPIGGASVSLQASMPGGLAPVMGAIRPKTVALQVVTRTSSAGNLDAKAAAELAARRAQEYVESSFAKLTAAEKVKGAAALNASLKLNPPLKGTESYKEIAARVGAHGAAAACGAVGLGMASKYCEIAGAYLGVKGAELAKKAAAAVADAAKDAANAVGDAASKVWNSIF